MRRGKGTLRSPKGTRILWGDSRSKNVSVGQALRIAKRDLFLRRFFLLLGALLVAGVLIVLFLNGYVENMFHTVLDYLM